jgi:hypothetical protein
VIYCFSTKWWVQYFDVDAPGLAMLVIVVTRNHIDPLRNNFEIVWYGCKWKESIVEITENENLHIKNFILST